jgi:hypothetical protein
VSVLCAGDRGAEKDCAGFMSRCGIFARGEGIRYTHIPRLPRNVILGKDTYSSRVYFVTQETFRLFGRGIDRASPWEC